MNKLVYIVCACIISMGLVMSASYAYASQPSTTGSPTTQSGKSSLDSGAFKAFWSKTNYSQSNMGTGDDVVVVAGRIVGRVIGILGIMLAIYLVYGGFKYFTAGGEEGKVDDAKKIIRNAIIGMAIALSAFSITTFVVNSLTTAVN